MSEVIFLGFLKCFNGFLDVIVFLKLLLYLIIIIKVKRLVKVRKKDDFWR